MLIVFKYNVTHHTSLGVDAVARLSHHLAPLQMKTDGLLSAADRLSLMKRIN